MVLEQIEAGATEADVARFPDMSVSLILVLLIGAAPPRQ